MHAVFRIAIGIEADDPRVAATAYALAERLTGPHAHSEVLEISRLGESSGHDAVVLVAAGDDRRWSASVTRDVSDLARELQRRPVWLASVERARPPTPDSRGMGVDAIGRLVESQGHRLLHVHDVGSPTPGEVEAMASHITKVLEDAGGSLAVSTGSRASERSTRLPSHARGRLFWLALIGVWPVLIVAAIVGWSVVGGELAFWIASACSAAFCVDVLLPQILFEVDDGDAGPPSFEELG